MVRVVIRFGEHQVRSPDDSHWHSLKQTGQTIVVVDIGVRENHRIKPRDAPRPKGTYDDVGDMFGSTEGPRIAKNFCAGGCFD